MFLMGNRMQVYKYMPEKIVQGHRHGAFFIMFSKY